jgi:hypothetical protein
MPTSRLILVAVLATACHAATAQTAVPPAVTVQQLAPQLITFAGSSANFQSLVNGLAQGAPVQLFTTLPNGFVQTVTFTPTAAMTPLQIAQVLEGARQQLIGLGIATPTAEQLGFTLMGGVVPTALGGQQVPGVLNPAFNPANPPSPAAQLQQQSAVGGTTASTAPVTPSIPGITNGVNVQLTPGAALTNSTTTQAPPRFTSDSTVAPGTTSRSPTPLPSASPLPAVPASPGIGSSPPSLEPARQGPTRLGH